ncbi:MAG: protein kinase, partial [Chloroflexi bacterium]|nr:protein kinase [Chloroflexota bacterium]
MADLTGHTLGQYTLGQRIGKGGMATVYMARQASMSRDVAIKVMSPDLNDSEEFVARFQREARVIARLQHPHILPVYDFGRSGDYIYLVMRLVTGSVLNRRLEKGTLTLQETDRLLTQIASALEYAHRQGVVHRDLKPNNVLLDEDHNAYLTDFGIAKMLAGPASSQNLTETGRIMGTPAYMAPEQWRSEAVDARTDIYALGVILYEMVTGGLPFRAETPYSMMYQHFDAPPPLPRVINPDLPEAVEHVMLQVLAKRPEQRYLSAQQLAQDFSHALESLSTAALTQPVVRATPEQVSEATQAARAVRTPPPVPQPAIIGTPAYGPPAQPSRAAAPVAAPAVRRGGIALWSMVSLIVVAIVIITALIVYSITQNGDGSTPLPTHASFAQQQTGSIPSAGTTPVTPPADSAAAPNRDDGHFRPPGSELFGAATPDPDRQPGGSGATSEIDGDSTDPEVDGNAADGLPLNGAQITPNKEKPTARASGPGTAVPTPTLATLSATSPMPTLALITASATPTPNRTLTAYVAALTQTAFPIGQTSTARALDQTADALANARLTAIAGSRTPPPRSSRTPRPPGRAPASAGWGALGGGVG